MVVFGKVKISNFVFISQVFLKPCQYIIPIHAGKDHDTIHAPPSCQKQDAHHVTSSTANEDQEIDSSTICALSSATVQHQDTSRYDGDHIYSNVSLSSESQIPPDNFCYSSVSFDKHTDCSTVSLTYSTIN